MIGHRRLRDGLIERPAGGPNQPNRHIVNSPNLVIVDFTSPGILKASPAQAAEHNVEIYNVIGILNEERLETEIDSSVS